MSEHAREELTAPEASVRLLVVDDERPQREMLSNILERAGYEVTTAGDGREALDRLERSVFDLLLTDQRMPEMGGLELLAHARRLHPGLRVVMMTAHGSVPEAVSAIKQGAADYLIKPFGKDELLMVLEKTVRQRKLEQEVASLRGAMKQTDRLGRLIGKSREMRAMFEMIERVAAADAAVLIRGESGTGKELVAKALHACGPRAEGPFVALNCAAVPDQLLESEFFGFEKGAFTGADRAHAGRFEQAHGGMLFLDEIGAMPASLQAKLLRVLQEGEVQRLGATRSRRVDVRVIAATCEDLEEAVRQRAFREDLFYRLNVVALDIPPLREREGDVRLLAEHFLDNSRQRLSRPNLRFAPELLDRLETHPWPGNVRELENCIERMAILAREDSLGIDDLPPALSDDAEESAGGAFPLPADGVELEQVERALILQALQRSKGSLGPAAQLLGISYKTLQYRLKKFGIQRESFES